MKQIRVRVWDKATNKMVLLDQVKGWKLHFDGSVDYEWSWATGDLELMRYTGLKDKNGKSIYEGDIVRIKDYKQTWKYGTPEIDWKVFEVKWNRYTYKFENSLISMPFGDCDTRDLQPWTIEIIGNIKENPDLLTN